MKAPRLGPLQPQMRQTPCWKPEASVHPNINQAFLTIHVPSVVAYARQQWLHRMIFSGRGSTMDEKSMKPSHEDT